jgi:hypothetical protein
VASIASSQCQTAFVLLLTNKGPAPESQVRFLPEDMVLHFSQLRLSTKPTIRLKFRQRTFSLSFRVGRFIEKNDFLKKNDSIDFSFDKKPKKIGKMLETCKKSGGLQTIRIQILYPGLFQMCVKAKIRPKYS